MVRSSAQVARSPFGQVAVCSSSTAAGSASWPRAPGAGAWAVPGAGNCRAGAGRPDCRPARCGRHAAVQLVETSEGILVNELAMRPHNSGHLDDQKDIGHQPVRAAPALAPDHPLVMIPPPRRSCMANVLGGAAADDDWAVVLDERFTTSWCMACT